MAAIDKSLYEQFEIEAVDGSKSADIKAVSYTHLTLPTICSV